VLPFSKASFTNTTFFHLLKHGCTHMQLPPRRSKRCTLSIDKTATFNLTPSGVTSGLKRPSWPLLRRSSPGMVENKRSVNFRRFGLGDAGVRLIVASVIFATTLISLTYSFSQPREKLTYFIYD
jgi:hypothetical protein